MFKKSVWIFLLLFLPGLFAFSAGEALAAEVALTSVGQSPDAVMVGVMLKRIGIAADYNAAMSGEDLTDHKVLVAVIGGSSKGLGAAGIDRNQELKRGVNLANAARDRGMKVLVMHVGGEGRRGELSDLFIEGVVPLGDALIIVRGANADGIFDRLKPAGVSIVETESVQTAGGDLQAVLKEWGVTQ